MLILWPVHKYMCICWSLYFHSFYPYDHLCCGFIGGITVWASARILFKLKTRPLRHKNSSTRDNVVFVIEKILLLMLHIFFLLLFVSYCKTLDWTDGEKTQQTTIYRREPSGNAAREQQQKFTNWLDTFVHRNYNNFLLFTVTVIGLVSLSIHL